MTTVGPLSSENGLPRQPVKSPTCHLKWPVIHSCFGQLLAGRELLATRRSTSASMTTATARTAEPRISRTIGLFTHVSRKARTLLQPVVQVALLI